MTIETAGTSSSGRLYLIYHLLGSYQPVKFSRSKDPAVAEEWIEFVESVMGLFKLSEREKVRFAVFYLRGDAKVWWSIAKATVSEQQMTWAEFRWLFDAEYRGTEMMYAKA